jgi:hypothetical protein
MGVNIESQDLTLFIDYDRDKLINLSYRGRVEYFELRVRKILMNPLQIMLLPEVFDKLEPQDSSSVAWLCIVSLVCAGIEALGSFYAGRDGIWETFRDFLKDYMDSSYTTQTYHSRLHGTITYGEALRRYFRNGLSHGFSIVDGGVEHHYPKYFEVNQFGLQIDPRSLCQDFQQAFSSYVNHLYNASQKSTIVTSFLQRFEDVFIKGK